MFAAVVAGHICVDLIPQLSGPANLTPGTLLDVGPLTLLPGGCVANTGGDLLALGAPARLAADVGDDDLGQLLRHLLAGRGVSTAGLRVIPGNTTSYSVVVEAPGHDRVFWHHVGANAHFDGAGLDLTRAQLLHLGYPSLLPAVVANGGAGLQELLERARAARLTTSLDLAVVDRGGDSGRHDWSAILERTLPLTDVFSPSVDDIASALGRTVATSPEALRTLAAGLVAAGAAVVALTAGPDGLLLRSARAERLRAGGAVLAGLADEWAERELWVPTLPARVVRTTGAGDAATAGLLYGLLAGLTAEDSVMAAAGAAALKLSGRDPLPAYEDGEIGTLQVTAPDRRGWGRGRRGVFTGPEDRRSHE